MRADAHSRDPSFAPTHTTAPPHAVLVANGLLRKDSRTQKILLDHLSLSISEGQRIALVGPSGSGKSLLLRSLARLDPVDAGTLTWKGRRVADHDVPSYRSQVSYVAQQAQFASGTVESILAHPFRFRVHRSNDRGFDRQRVLNWLGEADRDESFLRQPVEQLSGGERQLLAILRVIQLEPAVLLLDEPTAALDQQTTRSAEQWILQWHAAAAERAFVWATHDPQQPQRVADAVLSLSAGRWRNEADEAAGAGSPPSTEPQSESVK